jgi:hypothetical protein
MNVRLTVSSGDVRDSLLHRPALVSGPRAKIERKSMLKSLVLAIATAGAIGLAASATPANARIAGPAAPAVESNKLDVRCHHHRWSSRWHCYRRHHHWHAQPFYYQPYHFHRHHRWHSRRHWW